MRSFAMMLVAAGLLLGGHGGETPKSSMDSTLAVAAPAVATVTAEANPMTTYSEAASGVSFQYPSVWKRVAKPDAMTQPFLQMAGHPAVVDVEFSPKSNLYEKTNLVGLDFVYSRALAASQAACAKLGDISEGSGAPGAGDDTWCELLAQLGK